MTRAAKMPPNFALALRASLHSSAGEDLGSAMQDLVMLVFTAVFFTLAFLYVRACQKLR